jgi:hypothetical protein
MGSTLFFIAFTLLVSYLVNKSHRKRAQQIQQHGFRTRAVVCYYKEEYVRVAGSWRWLEYPYVEYVTREGNLLVSRLKYASSKGQLLKLGQEVEVVLYDSILYYAPALQPSCWLN